MSAVNLAAEAVAQLGNGRGRELFREKVERCERAGCSEGVTSRLRPHRDGCPLYCGEHGKHAGDVDAADFEVAQGQGAEDAV